MLNLNLKGIWIPIEILIDTNLSDKISAFIISAWKFETEQGFIESRKNLKNVFLGSFFYLNCEMQI